ncbi:MAG: hypothetical protein AABX29_03880 [Nanoarchaeota archaeon]
MEDLDRYPSRGESRRVLNHEGTYFNLAIVKTPVRYVEATQVLMRERWLEQQREKGEIADKV